MNGCHVDTPQVDVLLQRLDRVQRSGNGWRSRCPACGGSSQKVSIAQADDRILLHCFGGCRPDEVLDAVGLRWADIMPPRHWPASPEEQRRARRALKEAGWTSAISVLALEAKVVLFAGRDLAKWKLLQPEDDRRLAEAVRRIDHATSVLIEGNAYRPAAKEKAA